MLSETNFPFSKWKTSASDVTIFGEVKTCVLITLRFICLIDLVTYLSQQMLVNIIYFLISQISEVTERQLQSAGS